MGDLGGGPLTRRLGKTGIEVTSFGLGGEGVLRTWARQAEAVALIWRALELGVTYFDSAHAYAGSEDYHGAVWGEHPRLRDSIFLCSKSGERTKLGARRELEMTLKRMRVDHLDLWQVHDVRTNDEWERIMGPGGALEAFVGAYQAGLTRFIGITGHYDPAVLERAITEFEFHTLLMPVNPPESKLPGFLDRLLPAALERDMGVIGMKVMGGGTLPQIGLPPASLVRFALSQPISVAIVGCGSTDELEANLAAAQQPFSDDDATALDVEYDPLAVTSYRGTFKDVNIIDELPPDVKGQP
jgi:aryl-alcohol dehydrogenase-like predicted oxidoreductase